MFKLSAQKTQLKNKCLQKCAGSVLPRPQPFW